MDANLADSIMSTNAGFRLQYLEVLNWGTFNKVRWKIEPNGFNGLLTGDIGSGKSTLVDALTCLLVPHNKIVFNKAAGAEGKERNLLSYVKGEYKKEKEEITKVAKKVFIRPNDDTYTVIIGNFSNRGYEEHVCLSQVFWVGKENKIEKLLIISDHPLTIAQNFSGFSDINDLRKRLRNIDGISLFNDNFTQYSEHFRRLFGMNSEKAIDLFYQTVSMKSVSSLTDFVRDQMLEKTDVKEQITALLKRFDDLNKAHATVVNSREQFQILKPLTEFCADFGLINNQIEEIETMVEVIPEWFDTQKERLLKNELLILTEVLELAEHSQKKLVEQKQNLERKRLGILQDIDNNGGKRLEQIETEIRQNEKDKGEKKNNHDAYEKLAKPCGLGNILNEEDFRNNIIRAYEIESACKTKSIELRERRDNLMSELRKCETEVQLERKELQSLKARKTQIPGWLINFREQLCKDLQIETESLPFAGELLKVNELQVDWEGAIEKLLRDLGISLLVPKEHYRSVSKYVNDNIMRGLDGRGIKLTYLEADIDNPVRITKHLDNDSIIYKVDIKSDTIFESWLESHLERSFGDFHCVDLNHLPSVSYGITKQGLIKSGRIRHTKDDRKRIDDKLNYVLGWSNVEKIKALERAIEIIEEKTNSLKEQRIGIEKEQSDNDVTIQQVVILLSVKNYEALNWRFHVEKIYQLEQERGELLHNNDILSLLHQSKDELEIELNSLNKEEKEKNEEIGGLKTKMDLFSAQLLKVEDAISKIAKKSVEIYFPIIEEKMLDKNIRLSTIDKQQEQFRKLFEGENGELKKLRTKLSSLRSNIEKKMREIKEHSKAEYNEIGESIDARAEYLEKFEKLVAEDLKRHEERFKEELNKNTINSIAVFDTQLERHEKEINHKIKIINQHLREIVYNTGEGTFITILMDATPDKEIRLFKEELKKCYIHSFSSNSDLYTEEKYEQVKKILDRFANQDTTNKEWTNMVTDVRQWFEFNASERYIENDKEKEFYEGSGGKSGGQKEKLAYTILASALAYQFGLQFGEVKSRSFRFVVIDEAFGRGSDESTRYGLELFKKLNLQLLIVTPLQKIHIIEGHASSFHFVSNKDGNNSQVSNFTKEEYVIEKTRHNNLFKENTSITA